jgi:hypothetical protein
MAGFLSPILSSSTSQLGSQGGFRTPDGPAQRGGYNDTRDRGLTLAPGKAIAIKPGSRSILVPRASILFCFCASHSVAAMLDAAGSRTSRANPNLLPDRTLAATVQALYSALAFGRDSRHVSMWSGTCPECTSRRRRWA